ncbi:hypothetical protein KR222_008743, partial [Zaprionus bogoriensis]
GIPNNPNLDTSPFVKLGQGLYHFETQYLTNWFDANNRCHRLDAELVSFETLDEWHLINNYLRDKSIEEHYWTAGNDLAKQHTHIWLSNGQPIAVPIWAADEPNNQGGNERCDELGYRAKPSDKRGLNDESCTSNRRYICEARNPKTASFIIW